MRIAVVGSGAAGLGAAWLLSKKYDVTVFEAGGHAGGHCHTHDVDWRDRTISVDTGFIVYNEPNYPNLSALFRHLDVATEDSQMSFSVHTGCGGLEWAGTNLLTVFAQARNLGRPRFIRMLLDLLRFNRSAPSDLAAGRLAGLTLGDYLDAGGYGDPFRRWYLLPMGAAIWSCSVDGMLRFPAESFVRFFANHGLLTVNDQPQWRTVSGGSRSYVERILQQLPGEVLLNTPVIAIKREPGGVLLRDAHGRHQRFDHVVVASHADQALAMLADPNDDERELLGAFSYQANRAVLHRDGALMPRRRRIWSSWNYAAESMDDSGNSVSLTYWMNKLQNIDRDRPLFVTVNPNLQPRDELVLAEMSYDHPLFDASALAAQQRLDRLQGTDRIWYCGSYFGYGFHEDAFTSGLEVAEALGVRRPWVPGKRRLLSPTPAPWRDDAAFAAAGD